MTINIVPAIIAKMKRPKVKRISKAERIKQEDDEDAKFRKVITK